jgi:hypothetical protein
VRVPTLATQAAGVGHVLATDAIALEPTPAASTCNGQKTPPPTVSGKNLVFARCESRYATSIFSPLGVVTLDLTP